ncbi:hypothetical protein BJV82DRAFT_607601 [Fennellomyces sp. T-0311]|nr:hypothetical protein BJV82DRAFT_607601 [Fennellomyces sp. T-0311]
MTNSTPQDCRSIKEKPIKEEHHAKTDANDTKGKHDIPKEDMKYVERDTPKKDTKDVKYPREGDENNKDDTSSTPDTAETKDLRRARHPRLDGDKYECYISKKGDLYEMIEGSLKLVPRPEPRKYAFPLHRFKWKGKQIGIRAEELMVETFLGSMDTGNQYIIHKDVDKDNYALDNLAVGDLDTLRKTVIEHFKKLEPDVQYVKVKDLDDTLTFDDYIVSSTGKVFCLSKLRLFKGFTTPKGYGQYGLVSDPQGQDGVRVRKYYFLHGIVFHSFHGRVTNDIRLIYHVDGDRSNNSLDNIKCETRKEVANKASSPANRAAQDKNRKHGLDNPVNALFLECLPLITEETKWKTIGVLPWNGLSFSDYQVSDAGHVRKISGEVPRIYHKNGVLRVRIVPDKSSDVSNTERPVPHVATISRLVAHAFVDGYSETSGHVMHRNKNILDNRAENLEWIYSSHARRVIVTLVNDPSAVKEYPTMKKAKQDLGTTQIFPVKGDGSYIRSVRWDDGVIQDARIQVL